MTIEVERKLFEKIWGEVLKKYFEQELELKYSDPKNPPYSMNQVLGNTQIPWDKSEIGMRFTKNEKKTLPVFVGVATYEFSKNLNEQGVGGDTYKFGGSTFRDRYDDLKTDKPKPYIGTTDHFMLALVRTLGYESIEAYCEKEKLDIKNIVRNGSTKSTSNLLKKIDDLNNEKQYINKLLKFWKILAAITSILLITSIVLLLKSKKLSNIGIGQITRQVADTTTLAKGILGNWYSYNRTYEARGKNDGLIFNKMAWNFSADENGFIKLQRHWKAMDFDGWTEFIGGSTPQIHFFLNVYQNGSNYKNPVGYRHFICDLWGENHKWLNADTLSCICTTYNFSDSHLGEPLASREILIRQPTSIPFDSLKNGVGSLTILDEPWLEKFLPKDNSYLFQKPK